jgi:hypothetical protein
MYHRRRIVSIPPQALESLLPVQSSGVHVNQSKYFKESMR